MNGFSISVTWVLASVLTLGCGGKSHEADCSASVPPKEDDALTGASAMGGRATSPSDDEVSVSGEGGVGSVGGEPSSGGDGSAGGAGGESVELPYCSGVPTTTLVLSGNLDAQTIALDSESNPWDLDDPDVASNLSFATTAYDAVGRAHGVEVYFRKSDKWFQRWSYYAMADGFELSRGDVQFDEAGSFVAQEPKLALTLPLPTPAPKAPEIRLVLDGLTSLRAPTTVVTTGTDGEGRKWGRPCTNEPSEPGVPVLSAATCVSRVTERIRLFGDVAPSPPSSGAWDPFEPATTSMFSIAARAYDEKSAEVSYRLYFRRESEQTFSVHALLEGDLPGVELGGGRFEFDVAGYVADSSALRLELPGRSGATPRYVTLDLSPVFDDSGARVSGLELAGSTSAGYQFGIEPGPLECRRR